MPRLPLLRRSRHALLPALIGIVVATLAGADASAPARPRYLDLRYDENWSVLAGQKDAVGADFFDPVKYISLDESGSPGSPSAPSCASGSRSGTNSASAGRLGRATTIPFC